MERDPPKRASSQILRLNFHATEALNAAELRAEPTRRRLERLHAVIDQAKQSDGIDDIRERWDDLDAKAARASNLGVALDHWKRWADGHPVDRDELADVAAALEVSRSPHAAQLAEHLRRIEGVASLEMNRATTSLDGPGLEL